MSGEEEFEEYASALGELVINSKPIISSLTMLAGEIAGKDEARAAKVAELIRQHIRNAPPKLKLCGFYLLDSVVKNLRGHFVRCFAKGLSDLFLPAYAKVDAAQKKSMAKLFDTWKPVFPASALEDIEPHITPAAGATAAAARVASHAPPVSVAPPQWQMPQQQWAPPAQQWVGYPAPMQQAPYGGYGLVAPVAPLQPSALNPLGGSGADLSALIASLEAKQLPGPLSVATPATAVSTAPGEPLALTVDFDPKKDLATLSVRRESVISSLYFELPFQCSQNGRRFRSQAELDAHMDFLHARRKRRRDGTVSRKWFVDVGAWLKGLKTMAEDTMNFFGGGDDKDSAAEAHVEEDVDESVSVPVDESQPTCALSGEEFEKFWNETEQEWHYRGTIILDRAVGGAKKGSIVLARAVPKKRAATKGGAKSKTAAKTEVKTEDATRRSARGVKTKAEDESTETGLAKRARR